MKNMMVAQSGVSFDTKNRLIEFPFNLPTDTEILSVSVENKDDEHTLWFTYLTPSDAFDDLKKYSYPWNEFHFFIVKCNYTEFQIDQHKYIGNININDDTYAVFYEVGEIIKK